MKHVMVMVIFEETKKQVILFEFDNNIVVVQELKTPVYSLTR